MRERREFIERFSALEDKAQLRGATSTTAASAACWRRSTAAPAEIDDEEAGAAPDPRARRCMDESTPIELPGPGSRRGRRRRQEPAASPGRDPPRRALAPRPSRRPAGLRRRAGMPPASPGRDRSSCDAQRLVDAEVRCEQAARSAPGEGGRAHRRGAGQDARRHRGGGAARAGRAAGHRLLARPALRGDRRRPGHPHPDRLLQAAPGRCRSSARATTVVVATADPLDLGALDDIRAQLGTEVFPVLVPSQKILDAINHIHGQQARQGRRARRRATTRTRWRRGRGAGRHPRRQRRGAHHPLGQLAAVQRRQGAGQRYPHRAGREGGDRSATASTACCTRRATPPGSSCRRSSPA